ncbi:hypothetical protein [uncultured Psychroserpens sp.]|uniref:hypothetical protein n=1 Tax=uncultured Psychroserpens sp. TaxID=255436 RepID=UPI0026092A8F|nr:hypothetical protein [uncultured Psychroserpens sp.]
MENLKLKLIEKNKERLTKYESFKSFESKHLNVDLNSCLTKGFSSENPKYKYVNYLRYYFLHYTFENNIDFNDLVLLAMQKKDISLIFYSIYLTSQFIEEKHPRELQDWFIKSYVSLEKISDKPKELISFFLEKELIKDSQKKFFQEILNDFTRRYNAFNGTYKIEEEPFLHFVNIPF